VGWRRGGHHWSAVRSQGSRDGGGI
jgi:hypothetical protein